MHKAISAALISITFAVAAAPAFADYSEGDPRPMPLPSQNSAADVAAQTRQWLATAPAPGYPEGDPREIPQANQLSRAQVHAEAVAWVRSGLSEIAYGDSPMSAQGPAYQRALRSYSSLTAPSGNSARK